MLSINYIVAPSRTGLLLVDLHSNYIVTLCGGLLVDLHRERDLLDCYRYLAPRTQLAFHPRRTDPAGISFT